MDFLEHMKTESNLHKAMFMSDEDVRKHIEHQAAMWKMFGSIVEKSEEENK